MLSRRDALLASMATGIAAFGSAAWAAAPVRQALEQAVGPRGDVAGMIAVTVAEDGTAMDAYGSTGVPGFALDGDAVFEIMSITKVLTAILLADMVERGEVAFDDPVSKYLPFTLHARGRAITLLDLASYTSGLPNMPGNMPPDWYRKATVDYTEAQLFEFLADYVPEYDAGTHYEYANLGFSLLGFALARRAGKRFEDLLAERVCDPLGLLDTRITLTKDMGRRLVQGHEVDLKPAGRLFVPGLLAMGMACGTAKDMTRLLQACLGLADTPLKKPLARLTQTRRPTRLEGTEAALGWFVTSDGGEPIAWKTGLGSGCNTFVGFSLQRPRGAVVMSNFLWLPIDSGTINIGMTAIKPDFRPLDFTPLYVPPDDAKAG